MTRGTALKSVELVKINILPAPPQSRLSRRLSFSKSAPSCALSLPSVTTLSLVNSTIPSTSFLPALLQFTATPAPSPALLFNLAPQLRTLSLPHPITPSSLPPLPNLTSITLPLSATHLLSYLDSPFLSHVRLVLPSSFGSLTNLLVALRSDKLERLDVLEIEDDVEMNGGRDWWEEREWEKVVEEVVKRGGRVRMLEVGSEGPR